MNCHHCDVDAEDMVKHTNAVCPAWTEQPAALTTVIGPDLSLPVTAAMIRTLVGSEESNAVATFCSEVMLRKEVAERE